jgi:hypothetical protein
MKNTNRQTSPQTGRSTKEEKVGLSLLQSPALFEVSGNSYTYYNENQIYAFISRLITKKFKRCHFYSKPTFGFDGWRFFLIPLKSKIVLIPNNILFR